MRLYKLISASVVACVMLSTTGCLKDDDFDNGVIQSVTSQGNDPKVVELKVSATNNTNFVSIAIDNSGNDTIINFIPVNLSTPGTAAEDVHVTVELDTNLVNQYNIDNETAYLNLDASVYTIVNPVVTIPKGSHVGYLQIKVKPSDLIGLDVAFGFKITGVQEAGYTISSNFGTAVAALVIKNAYDGIYESVGYFDHPVYAGDFVSDWPLVTIGTYSNKAPLHVTVNFTSFFVLTVDPVTNLVAITSDDLPIDPYDPAKNYYDPVAKAYHLDFGYTTSAPRHLTCVATYKGPR